MVVVEDHLYHIGELLSALAAADPELPGETTVVCLDRPGPDTRRAALAWLDAYPALQLAVAWDGGVEASRAGQGTATDEAGGGRLLPLPADVFTSSHRLCQVLAGALRPGGLLVQDVHLETLAFVPAARWWETIYLAATVRGMYASRPPVARFLSNKRGYAATFGRDLLDAGFDPRDVMDKGELARVVVPTLRACLARAFPCRLRMARGGEDAAAVRVAADEAERQEIERELDLVLWSAPGGAELGGRALAGEPGRRIQLKEGQHEAATWRALVEDRLDGGGGLPVVEVGARLAPAGAGRAEITNVAARHLHHLRGRLADPAAILTVRHAYRLGEHLSVGCVAPRLP
jgi:hypothetical protein